MFQAAPEALDKHIVHPVSFAIHADLDVIVFEYIREILPGKLTTLVTVKDFRCAVGRQGFCQRLNTRGGIQTVGQAPREHLSRAPVHDCKQIQKTLAHRNVRQVCTSHLIGSVNLQIPQQIGIDLVLWIGTCRSGAPMQSAYAHESHQTMHALAINPGTITIPEIIP